MFSRAILHCGGETIQPIALRAGPLTLSFEPQTAVLRHLRLGDHEVVRAIYAAIRDQDWATISPQVSIHEQEINADSFRIAFNAGAVPSIIFGKDWSRAIPPAASASPSMAKRVRAFSAIALAFAFCIRLPSAPANRSRLNIPMAARS
jgi:hypothetical protein